MRDTSQSLICIGLSMLSVHSYHPYHPNQCGCYPCDLASTFIWKAKHSLKFFFTQTSGVQSIPEFVVVAFVDEVQGGDCNSSGRGPEFKSEWIKKLMKDEPQHLEWYTNQCLHTQDILKNRINHLMQRFNQTGGVHILQTVSGCEWDDETGQINGFNQYGYDGEDFLTLDLQNLTWIAPKQQAVITKLRWNANIARLKSNKYFYMHECPRLLKKYVHYTRNLVQTAVLPSVSLLQKTPSSPVSCHATGFYPDRAKMFWRKDGVELHEGVDPGEILPNNDRTFQMSVDLKLSSVTPEDWERYDCMFQFSDVKNNSVTKLDKTSIRTNWGKPDKETSSKMLLIIPAVVVILIAGYAVWKKFRAPDNVI